MSSFFRSWLLTGLHCLNPHHGSKPSCSWLNSAGNRRTFCQTQPDNTKSTKINFKVEVYFAKHSCRHLLGMPPIIFHPSFSLHVSPSFAPKPQPHLGRHRQDRLRRGGRRAVRQLCRNSGRVPRLPLAVELPGKGGRISVLPSGKRTKNYMEHHHF